MLKGGEVIGKFDFFILYHIFKAFLLNNRGHYYGANKKTLKIFSVTKEKYVF